MKSLFEGVCVALATPFLENGRVDFVSLEKLIDRCLKGGVQAIAILATTGESPTINEKERNLIIKFVRKRVPRDVKLIVGTGSNNMDKAISNTTTAKKLGADGVLVVTPYYNKTTQEGIVEYYRVLNCIGVPIIAYNVPSRTGLNIDLKTIKRLIKEDLIFGIKESTVDINRIIELIHICEGKIAVYSGEDNLNFLFYVLGGVGAVSVTANIFPQEVVRLYDLVKTQKIKKAKKLAYRLDGINKLMFCETNPTPVKCALNILGLTSSYVRPPLVKVAERNKIKIKKELQKLSKNK